MANDIRNRLDSVGINAVIMVGSTDRSPSTIFTATHAWVMMQTNLNKWIAVETTGVYGGWLVCQNPQICGDNNPLYYTGWVYKDDVELKYYESCDENGCWINRDRLCPMGYTFENDNLCHSVG